MLSAVTPRAREVALVILVGAAAIGVRVATWSLVDYRTDVGDGSSYLRCAMNLLDHGTFSDSGNGSPEPSVFRPPLYAAFVAAGLWLHDSIWTIRLLQLGLNLLTAWLLALVCRRWAQAVTPWVVGAMVLSPFEAVYSGAVLSETLTEFLFAATAAAFALVPGLRRWLVGGACLGVLVLCRDVYLPLAGFIALAWWLWGTGTLMARLKETVLMAAAMALVVAPWTARNFSVTGKLIPVSAGRLGLSLWMGTWARNGDFTQSEAATGSRLYPDEAFWSDQERTRALAVLAGNGDPAEGDRVLRGLAIDHVRQRPFHVVEVWLRRAPLLWLGTRFDIFDLDARLLPRGSSQWKAFKAAMWGTNFLLVVLGAVGMVWSLRRRSAALWLAIPIVFTVLVYFPLNSFENRYSQPVFPFVLVFCGAAMAELKAAISRRREKAGEALEASPTSPQR